MDFPSWASVLESLPSVCTVATCTPSTPYCKRRKVCAACVYARGADCASTASCRRKQVQPAPKKMSQIIRPPTHVPHPLPLLYFTELRGDSLCRLFQTWTRDKACSGAAPDWLRRPEPTDLNASEGKCYCFSSVRRAQDLSLESLWK